jgi:hypothetical protein
MSKQKTPNAQQNFSDFVKSLKGSNSTLYENVDIMWNVPNALALSNEMLLFLQSISSTITFIEDYTTVAEKLNLTQEQASSIQEINANLILYQRLIIKYCAQQYLFGSMIKSLIDDILLSVPEIKDIQSIDEFTEYMMNFEKSQTAGGQKGGCGKICLTLIMLYLILVATMPSETEAVWPFTSSDTKETSNQEISTALTTINQPGAGAIVYKDPNTGITTYNTGMISLNTAAFFEGVRNTNLTTSKIEDITKAVVKYSPPPLVLITKKITDLVGLTDVNETIIESAIRELNSRSKKISMDNGNTCIKIIEEVYRYDGFSTLYDLNTAGNITAMVDSVINGLQIQEKKAWDDFKHNALEKGFKGAAITSAVCMRAIGEPYTCGAAGVGSSVIAVLQEYLGYADTTRKANEIADEKRANITKSNPLTTLNEGEKLGLKTNIREASKVYCSNAFNLNWKFNSTDNTIQVIGDHVSYENIEGLFSTIQQNLAYQITTKLSSNPNDPDIIILSSLHQRLEILKRISGSIHGLLSFQFSSNIDRDLRVQVTNNVLDDIISSNSQKLDELSRLSKQAMMVRPLDKERQEAVNEQLDEILEVKRLEFQGNELRREAENIDIENKAADRRLAANATKVAVKGWTDIVLSPIVGIGQGAGGSIGEFLGGTVGEFFRKLLGEWNTIGIILGSVTVIALGACVVGGQINMFKDAAGTVWMVITSPFRALVYVYKVVVSPVFGIILKPMGAIFNRGKGALGLVDGPPGGPRPNVGPNINRIPTNVASSASAINTITVQVKDPNNAAVFHPYTVDPNREVRELKQQIYQKQRIQVANQRLQYIDTDINEWKVLNDNDTFAEKGIKDQSQLRLKIVNTGGKRLSRKIKTNMHKNVTKKRRFRVKGNKKTKKNRKRVTKHRK